MLKHTSSATKPTSTSPPTPSTLGHLIQSVIPSRSTNSQQVYPNPSIHPPCRLRLMRGPDSVSIRGQDFYLLAHAVWCRHDEIFQRMVQLLPAGELIADRSAQLPIHGVLPGAPDYVFLAVMRTKQDALAILLARHPPHQEPAWVLPGRTALVLLSRAPIHLIRLLVQQGIDITTSILGMQWFEIG
ncbi:hypothetical protein BDV10DRAFT_83235 [Aspergillus recurvatus]